jgi:GntR family transcriptional regulator, histidine utilization repressor
MPSTLRRPSARNRLVQTERPTAGEPALARYALVKDHVARKISSGDWPAGYRLPSEYDLVAQFGISRMTVNRALRELAAEHRIVRVAGVGSYVAENKPQSTLVQIGVISEEIRARGHDYRCLMLVAERLAAPADVGFWLDLAPSDPVFHTICLHLENNVPVQLEDRYVNAKAVPEFLAQGFSVLPHGCRSTRSSMLSTPLCPTLNNPKRWPCPRPSPVCCLPAEPGASQWS